MVKIFSGILIFISIVGCATRKSNTHQLPIDPNRSVASADQPYWMETADLKEVLQSEQVNQLTAYLAGQGYILVQVTNVVALLGVTPMCNCRVYEYVFGKVSFRKVEKSEFPKRIELRKTYRITLNLDSKSISTSEK